MSSPNFSPSPLFYFQFSSINSLSLKTLCFSPQVLHKLSMASGAEASETPLIERLINRDISLFLPFILGVTDTTPRRDTQDPDEETTDRVTPRDRIILVNPFTQGMTVIEGTSNFDALLHELSNKGGQPPASKASIESMAEVVIEEEGDGECVICLEEWEIGGVAKEMPCKHRFHAECIKKWLGIHGSCPVCRYKMPVDEEGVGKKRESNDSEGNRRMAEMGIWLSFSFNGNRRGDSNDSSSSPTPGDEI